MPRWLGWRQATHNYYRLAIVPQFKTAHPYVYVQKQQRWQMEEMKQWL